MRRNIFIGLTWAGLIFLSVSGVSLAAPDCTDPKHADKPACSGDGGDGGTGSGGLASNDISARWDGAVSGTGTTPRDCTLESGSKSDGTHTVYTCVQDQFHTVSVSLTGGEVADAKGGTPSAENVATCNGGFVFEAYPNAQYIVAAGGGEVCADPAGCQLTVHNMMRNQGGSGYDHVKVTGLGRIPQSATLNPFACPEDGSPAVTATYGVDTVDVALFTGKGAKADLVCRFDTTSGSNATLYQVTPACP